MKDWLNKTHIGDCRELLKEMAADGVRVQTCVTSPPYFCLRDYGVAGQIGLEPTPAEYVEQMVAVFRGVRDVLADDGTLWLNLGDSYASSPPGTKRPGSSERSTLHGIMSEQYRATLDAGTGTKRDTSKITGFKPKDLLGIPWRVAFALQQPYYAGRIKREVDRVWLAAMVDGEGCFYVHRRQAGGHAGDGYYRKADTYSPAFEIANTHKSIVDRCLEIAGVGSVICQEKDRRQPLWRWTVRATEAKEIARELFPYLVGKRQQCRIICGMPSNGERAVAAWEAMKLLHAGRSTDVDFQSPAGLHQPGWYLRSDVIWAKPNPMPESVTDRPTKAHEYLFLLAKSERYYYDSDSVRIPLAREWDNTNGGSWAHTERQPEGSKAGHHSGAYPKPNPLGANRRSVWTVSTTPFSGAHFATFPPALIEPCILAGSHAAGIVLDPFMGSGTTGQVATDLGRNFIGCELNPKYVELHEMRRTTVGMAI